MLRKRWYNTCMKRLLLIIIPFIFMFFQTKIVFAHVGGGPPFLEVNGQYAQTNPFFSNDPTINIPQDTNPDTNPILVNQPINFMVDTSKLLVPPEIAKASTFRWNFTGDTKTYEFGTHITHAYTKPGSYLITLDVKGPTDTDYLTIDTTEISILPSINYHVPHVKLSIETENHQSNKPIYFTAIITTDSHATIKSTIWTFGDGTSSTKQNALHTYTNLTNYTTYPVVLRVIDSNNFTTDTGVIIQVVNNKLQFIDANGNTTTIPVSNKIVMETGKQTSPHQKPILFIGISAFLSVSIVFLALSVYKKRNKVKL